MTVRLSELAELVGGEVRGNPDREIDAVRSLEDAGPRDLSFVTNLRYRQQAAKSGAGALLVASEIKEIAKDLLLVAEPYFALGQILQFMYPRPKLDPGIHETAIVGPGAIVDASAAVGPYSVIGDGSVIEAEVVIGSHVTVGGNCRLGRGTVVHSQVVLYDGCEVGQRCILHSGVVLGSDGFGYALHEGVHTKLQHAGRVIVEDDVEIGACSTVDRALVEETRIGAGTKIDNLVQVAHNVRLGRACLLVSQSGIAGSTRLGDGVVLAGQSGVSGHLELGDGVQVAAKSAVFKSLEPGSRVAGIPAINIAAWRRQQALAARLIELKRRLEELERKLGVTVEESEGG